mmetsp:Transcript_58484/g.109467  ORF Transcript_58484/g.109467 Transcript_58484/m.109467 type:complete len:407 (-) Transcript_58484:42-1262(-)
MLRSSIRLLERSGSTGASAPSSSSRFHCLRHLYRCLPAPPIRFDDVIQTGRVDNLAFGLCLIHDLLQDQGDLQEVNLLCKKELYRLLVRGGEDGRHGSANPTSFVGKADAGVLLKVWLSESELAVLALSVPPNVKVPAIPWIRQVGRDPRRMGERVENWQAHVRPSSLHQDGRVLTFHRAVHDGLRVDHHFDVVILHSVQPMRLDHLEALVHHCGRVDSNLGTHVPVRVGGRPLSQHLWVFLFHVLHGHVAECPSTSCEDDLLHAPFRDALHALEDRRVLGVDWQHADAILFNQGRDHRTPSDDRLLVGQSDVLTSLDGFDRGDEPCTADDASHNCLAVRMPGHFDLTLCSGQKYGIIALKTKGSDALLQVIQLRLVACNHLRFELLDLLEQQVHVLTCRERHRLE